MKWAGTTLVLVLTLCSLCRAQNAYEIGLAQEYSQTSDNNGTPSGTGLSASVQTASPNAFSSISLTVPGSTTYQLTESSSTFLTLPGHGAPNPGNGLYTFTTGVSIAANGQFASAPFLTGTSIESLSLTPTDQSITVTFSPFTLNSSAFSDEMFLALYSYANGTLSALPFLSSGATSYTFAPNTFLPDSSYYLAVNEEQSYGSSAASANYTDQVIVNFTTASAPEPSSGLLLTSSLVIFAALGFRLERQSNLARG